MLFSIFSRAIERHHSLFGVPMRSLTILACVATLGITFASAAYADSITVANTTDNVAYVSNPNGGPYNFYNGGTSAVGPGGVGDEFDTSQLAITATATTNGNYSVDLQYTTLFAGSETVGGASVYYPDIFLRSNAAGYSNAPFDYAISLGTQGANGGVAAGFYQNPSYLTSQQVWANRPGYIYTGQYTNTAAYQPGQSGFNGYNAPTVITGGTNLGAVQVSTGQTIGSSYVVDVQLTLTAAEAAVFANGFDVFWGTGDCANGSFLASVAGMTGFTDTSIPEPATLLLLAAGLLTLAVGRQAKLRVWSVPPQ